MRHQRPRLHHPPPWVGFPIPDHHRRGRLAPGQEHLSVPGAGPIAALPGWIRQPIAPRHRGRATLAPAGPGGGRPGPQGPDGHRVGGLLQTLSRPHREGGVDYRFLLHVLPKGFLRVRHFGFLANPCRAQASERQPHRPRRLATASRRGQGANRPLRRLFLPQMSQGMDVGNCLFGVLAPRPGRFDPLAALTAPGAQPERTGRPAAGDGARPNPRNRLILVPKRHPTPPRGPQDARFRPYRCCRPL